MRTIESGIGGNPNIVTSEDQKEEGETGPEPKEVREEYGKPIICD